MLGAMLLLILQSATSSRAAAAPRLIRAEAGPAGAARGGTFVLDEQRDAFDVSKDKQLYVVFEWEGAPGPHHCELSWMAPDGTVAMQASLDLDARGRRFSGYWSLLLSPAVPRGLWAAEVKVDGSPAGSRTFRITGPAVVKELPADELYRLATAASLRMTALIPGGEERPFSGFAVGPDAVLTTFGALNGASRIEVHFPDGSKADSTEVWSFSRDLDWALIKVLVPEPTPRLKIADAAKVGDRCLFVDIVDGQRQLSPCSILGENRTATVLRWTIAVQPADQAVGSPVLNVFGEIIGILGAATRPGATAFADENLRMRGGVGPSRSLAVFPAKGLQVPPGGVPDPLAAFWDRKLFYPPVATGTAVTYGFLAAGAADPRGTGARTTGGNEFSNRDAVMTAILQWEPREKLDSTLNHMCYDLTNRRVFEGKPAKVSFKPGIRVDSSSQVDISTLPPGEYRVDVLLGSEVAWRSFFRIR